MIEADTILLKPGVPDQQRRAASGEQPAASRAPASRPPPPESWAEALQPLRDEAGRINPALGVRDPDVEQAVLGRLRQLNPCESQTAGSAGPTGADEPPPLEFVPSAHYGE